MIIDIAEKFNSVILDENMPQALFDIITPQRPHEVKVLDFSNVHYIDIEILREILPIFLINPGERGYAGNQVIVRNLSGEIRQNVTSLITTTIPEAQQRVEPVYHLFDDYEPPKIEKNWNEMGF